MISIVRATQQHCSTIVEIGKVSVAEAHKDSCVADILNEYMVKNYNNAAIAEELALPENLYHIITYNNNAAGFSKIIFNVPHSNIKEQHITKLDRIYLLREFQGIGLGNELLNFNIKTARASNQTGIWLYTWVGNKKAIDFYIRSGFSIIGNHNFMVTKTHSNLNHHMFLAL